MSQLHQADDEAARMAAREWSERSEPDFLRGVQWARENPADPQDQEKRIGQAVQMPGTPAFTMAVFETAEVPVGTFLYKHSFVAKTSILPAVIADYLKHACLPHGNPTKMFEHGVRFAETHHNIKPF